MRFVGIDPSTKTGFVALDEDGNVLRAKELTGLGKKDPKRMATLIDEVINHIRLGDFILIEGFGFASQQAVQNGGIGWGIRNDLFRRRMQYIEVAPNAVKKFVNVTGWTGPPGNKVRLKDKEKKLAVMKAVEDHFNFTHISDNVVDAYIIARIAKGIYDIQNGITEGYTTYQLEVIDAIINPPVKKKKVRK